MRIPQAVYRGFATLLPALLGQGLIYLCISGQLGIIAAVGAIVTIGAVTLAAAALFRSETEARLVRSNAPPPMYMHGARARR